MAQGTGGGPRRMGLGRIVAGTVATSATTQPRNCPCHSIARACGIPIPGARCTSPEFVTCATWSSHGSGGRPHSRRIGGCHHGRQHLERPSRGLSCFGYRFGSVLPSHRWCCIRLNAIEGNGKGALLVHRVLFSPCLHTATGRDPRSLCNRNCSLNSGASGNAETPNPSLKLTR